VFSSPFFKNLGFGPLFCKIELNTMQKFWQKDGYSLFWILASRGQKTQNDPQEALMRQ
jgi:hypothetical protein